MPSPDLTPAILASLGPIGVLVSVCLLGGLYIYVHVGQGATKRYHDENIGRLDTIATEMTVFSNRMAAIEQWRISHDKQDDERHVRNDHEHQEHDVELGRHRDKLHDLSDKLAPVTADFQQRARRQRMNGGEG